MLIVLNKTRDRGYSDLLTKPSCQSFSIDNTKTSGTHKDDDYMDFNLELKPCIPLDSKVTRLPISDLNNSCSDTASQLSITS